MSLEKKILSLMENNAKLSFKNIALMVDETEEKVREIVDHLEKNKYILGYKAVVNWEKVGSDEVSAMIDVKVIPEREVGFDSIAKKICRFPEVRSVQLMSGAYDLSVVVSGESMKDVAKFISRKLSTLDQVQSTVTHFLLKRYKHDNFIFEDEIDDKRLVVSP